MRISYYKNYIAMVFICEKLKVFIYNSFSDLDVLFSFLVRVDIEKKF